MNLVIISFIIKYYDEENCKYYFILNVVYEINKKKNNLYLYIILFNYKINNVLITYAVILYFRNFSLKIFQNISILKYFKNKFIF